MKQTPNRPYDEPFREADKSVTVPRPARDVPRAEPHDTAPDQQDQPSPASGADEHEGATERDTGDRTGPGAGYDEEPKKTKDTGGVTS